MKNDKTIHIRLSSQEHEALIIEAEQCGMTVSSLVRKMILDNSGGSCQTDLKTRQEIVREVSLMCNAINELCDKVGNDYPRTCEILSEEAGKICQLLKQ